MKRKSLDEKTPTILVDSINWFELTQFNKTTLHIVPRYKDVEFIYYAKGLPPKIRIKVASDESWKSCINKDTKFDRIDICIGETGFSQYVKGRLADNFYNIHKEGNDEYITFNLHRTECLDDDRDSRYSRSCIEWE